MFEIGKRESRDSDLSSEREDIQTAGASMPFNTPSTTRVREAAVIGPSIKINGDLQGEEDLIIQGEVHGTIQLKDKSLTVGSEGKVFADVYAHTVMVEGKVKGDLYGAERVAVKRTGDVQGNIVSPRVSLEDGGRFKGSVEMDDDEVRKAFGTSQKPKEVSGGSSTTSSSTAKPEWDKAKTKQEETKLAASGGGSATIAHGEAKRG